MAFFSDCQVHAIAKRLGVSVGDLASPEEAKMAILGSLGQDSDESHDKHSSEGEHSDDTGGVIGTGTKLPALTGSLVNLAISAAVLKVVGHIKGNTESLGIINIGPDPAEFQPPAAEQDTNAFFVQGLTQIITMEWAADRTVDSVICELCDREALERDDFWLLFGGKPMTSGLLLSDYNVQRRSTLHLVARLHGGGKRGRSSNPFDTITADMLSHDDGPLYAAAWKHAMEFKAEANLDAFAKMATLAPERLREIARLLTNGKQQNDVKVRMIVSMLSPLMDISRIVGKLEGTVDLMMRRYAKQIWDRVCADSQGGKFSSDVLKLHIKQMLKDKGQDDMEL